METLGSRRAWELARTACSGGFVHMSAGWETTRLLQGFLQRRREVSLTDIPGANSGGCTFKVPLALAGHTVNHQLLPCDLPHLPTATPEDLRWL